MRELEINLMLPMQRWQWAMFVLTGLLWLALPVSFYYGLFHDLQQAILNSLVFFFLGAQMIYRFRYLKKLYLRIDDNEIAWRLIDGIEILQRMRPPISQESIAWPELKSLRHEASGTRFILRSGKDVFLPLSNFSYAQRQDVKRVLHLQRNEHGVEESAHEPHEAWHTDPAPLGDISTN